MAKLSQCAFFYNVVVIVSFYVLSGALRVAQRMGLPTDYKCETKILKAADRDKLDAKACPDCKKV